MVLREDLLLPYERLALIEALRRDLKIQQELAKVDGPWLSWHQYNVRMVKRLLDAINPKRHHPAQESMRWHEPCQPPGCVANADNPLDTMTMTTSAIPHEQEPGEEPDEFAAA